MDSPKIRAALAALMFIFILLAPVPAAAQVTGGAISGTISDETGAVIPGAQVVITNTGTAVGRIVAANEPWLYRAPNLLPGSYEITVSSRSPFPPPDITTVATEQAPPVGFSPTGTAASIAAPRPSTV